MLSFTCDLTVRGYGWGKKKCLLYSTRDGSSYSSREPTVCVCVFACVHACMFVNVCECVCVGVCMYIQY